MSTENPSSFLVHVSSSESRQIHGFLMDPRTGDLRLLEVVEVPGSGAPTRGNIPLSWDRDRKVLYAQNRVEPFPLSTFALHSGTGRLQLLQTVMLPAPMAYLSTTLNNKFMLGASYDGAMLTVNRIEHDGRIAMPALQTLQTPPKAHCIVEAPFGGFVYASSVDGDVILVYRLSEQTGRLDLASTTKTPSGSGPRHLVFHPKLDRLYGITEHAGSVISYDVERTTGALHDRQAESLMPPGFSGNALGADIHFTPDGTLLYACVRTTGAVAAFHVDSVTGTMTRAGSYNVEEYPRGFAIEPNGRFLLCAGQKSNRVSAYAIDAEEGSLKLIGRHTAGQMPSWVEIIPGPALALA